MAETTEKNTQRGVGVSPASGEDGLASPGAQANGTHREGGTPSPREKIVCGRSRGFFPEFTRRPGDNKTNMHYCPGCGHGILHKLIAETIDEFNVKDRTILISPVGCAVFAYYYFDCFGISVPHGRSPAVGTGLVRANPDSLVIGYQGDGDLGAIGFNHFIQAANRGENMAVFFVNNSVYGMTGGQAAPTTLPGQKTTTTPEGRSVFNEGFPLKVSEMISALDAPVYVERVALSTASNILKARRATRKAIRNAIDRKGFSLVECLSGCPVNLKMDARQMNEFIDGKMTVYFPTGCFKDIAETRDPIKRPVGQYDPDEVKKALYPVEAARHVKDDYVVPSDIFSREKRIKIAGFGGQGVLSLGIMIATMSRLRNFNVSWLPSYGPEMRGGTATCSVILSRQHIHSPFVANDCHLLVALNQPSLDRYFGDVKAGGVVIYDNSTIRAPRNDDRKLLIYRVPAAEIARKLGSQQFANSVILGALATIMQGFFLEGDDKDDFERVVEEAVRDCFSGKTSLIQQNINAYRAGTTAVERAQNID